MKQVDCVARMIVGQSEVLLAQTLSKSLGVVAGDASGSARDNARRLFYRLRE